MIFSLTNKSRGTWSVGTFCLLQLVIGLSFPVIGAGATVTAEMQKRIRAATFEVVIHKPEKDLLTYEKPLPMELVPFSERNDRYWSLGTAFAIGPNTFLSAGHVIQAGIGRKLGVPAIRDAQGQVYSVDRILKFSLHEDFVVFNVDNPPPLSPLETNTSYAIDDVVFAAGNALGSGVVIRDGLLTSLTPEEVNGRWKWLRFSAAASPGNSGGPLLDEQGRVIGIVIAKSPSENLNYALPIARVLDASSNRAGFDVLQSFSLPNLQTTTVVQFSGEFKLPLSYAEFTHRMQDALLNHYKEQQKKLLTAESEGIFPRGNSAKLLADHHATYDPSMVEQQDDMSWVLRSGTLLSNIDLLDGGHVSTGNITGATLFRIQQPPETTDDKICEDSQEFMDTLLKALEYSRTIGTEDIRIISIGPAQQNDVVSDDLDRLWQLRFWSMESPLDPLNYTLITMSLPLPNGCSGMVTLSPEVSKDISVEKLKFLANYFYITYSGTLPQWHAFVARRELLPAIFDKFKLTYDHANGFQFESPRLTFDIPANILQTTDHSTFDLEMTYLLDGNKLRWDAGGLLLTKNPGKDTFVAAYRRPKPATGAGKEVESRWDQMEKRAGDYLGTPGHDTNFEKFWLRMVSESSVQSSPAPVLYEVLFNTDERILPRTLEEMPSKLIKAVRVMEH